MSSRMEGGEISVNEWLREEKIDLVHVAVEELVYTLAHLLVLRKPSVLFREVSRGC